MAGHMKTSLEDRLALEPCLGLEKQANIGQEIARGLRSAKTQQAVSDALPELIPGITAGLGAGVAAYNGKSPSAGAAFGGALGAIPFLLKKGEATKEAIGVATLARAAATRGLDAKSLPAIGQLARKKELYGAAAGTQHAKNVVGFLKTLPKPAVS